MTKQKITILLCSTLLLVLAVPALAVDDYFAQETWEAIWQNERVVDIPIVFIHGIAGNTNHWDRTMQAISGGEAFHMRYYHDDMIFHNYYGDKPEHWIWSVSYYTVNPLEESLYGDLTLYAERLRNMLNLIKKMTGHDQVILIAHSMGGLVARKYMTLDEDCWNSVYRILTVGSPNEGVANSIGIVGQLEDLKKDSSFISRLNEDWAEFDTGEKKWGVVGAVETRIYFGNLRNDPNASDFAGPGFIVISSAIPGEWSDAVSGFNQPDRNTPRYGFRIAVDSGHMGLLYHEGTFAGIHWAIQKQLSKIE